MLLLMIVQMIIIPKTQKSGKNQKNYQLDIVDTSILEEVLK